MEIARTFHGFDGSIDARTIDDLLATGPTTRADGPAWDREVWERTNLEAVFLTNDFDDPLEGWDPARYVPCLRTDDLVLKLHEPGVVDRLRRSTGVDVGDLGLAPTGAGLDVRAVRGEGGEGVRHQPAARLRARG